MPKESSLIDKAARDNRANQLNQKHDAFWKSRGLIRPEPPVPGGDAEGPEQHGHAGQRDRSGDQQAAPQDKKRG